MRPARLSSIVGLLLIVLAVPQPRAAEDSDTAMLLTDFTPDSADFGWYVLNDNVMGGRSNGTFAERQGALVFTGNTNTNGGGFSSIRTNPCNSIFRARAASRYASRATGAAIPGD